MTNLPNFPVTVITGFLGGGQNHLYPHLMENAGSKAYWPCLSTEFGTPVWDAIS